MVILAYYFSDEKSDRNIQHELILECIFQEADLIIEQQMDE